MSPADDAGHGTHTSSTAAGVVVKGASVSGIGKGTARGGVPSARVAMYKVCWAVGCSDMDMLAGFDQAIADGVNFLSVSIGGPARDFFTDPIAIGAFHAMARGVLTSCSAGNGGPRPMSVENVAPWILTVAATTIDRQFITVAAFGDGSNATGMSINTFNPKKKMYPLTSGRLAASFPGDEDIFGSARGPQTVTPNILKPDLTAPGVDILAGYSKRASLTGYHIDNRYDVFNILSGTSMSCPHATATAAYVKSFHPDWSPAAIKSALMTTATPIKISDNFTLLGSGSGQIDPVKAVHPGLVYDIGVHSYISFLCKQGFNNTNIGKLIGIKNFNCARIKTEPGADGINYPSMHIQLLNARDRISAVFYRTVTNVGFGNSTYKAIVTAPKGLSVKVIPDTLYFSILHQKLSFKVVVKGPPMSEDAFVEFASLEWNDSKHTTVRSSILAIMCQSIEAIAFIVSHSPHHRDQPKCNWMHTNKEKETSVQPLKH
ncbi:unnamed protein product [Sphenostylis stenocarpa]|uniref:Uncharacterized protein n=1 Tax=Sphenostylis stenocarpa TaxID=92480 RepID=A0AA86VA83_9FABA|nr:unnamed protein product [Sphenostylis stenocarpa]